LFPAASMIGYGYGQWKQESVFKFGFLPAVDSALITAKIELPPGSSLAATQAVVDRVEKVMMQDPDVKFVLSNVGTQGMGGFGGSTSASNFAEVRATLYDRAALLDRMPWRRHEERLRWDRSDTEVAADLTYAIGRVPGATVGVSATDPMGFGSPIQLSFSGDNREQIVIAASEIRNRLAGGAVLGVINPDLSSKPGKPELRVVPDREALADQGIDAASAGAAIRTAYQGDDSVKMRIAGNEYDVRVMLDDADRNDPTVLSQVPLRFVQGVPVYLSQVASVETAPGVDRISRRARSEEILVTADLLPGYAAGTVAAQIDTWISKENLVPAGVSFRQLGQAEAQQREMGFLFAALFLGLALVYMLLASLYNNLLHPFVVQLAQPQAMVGALVALVIFDKTFSLVGFIGIITLVGLVGKNAILLVDYTNTLRGRGLSRHDAIVEAGPVRLRPILMTSLALILGMLPVALAIGRGSEFRDTIGITIIGGITLSTLLTLFVIPCSYSIFDELAEKMGRSRRKRREESLPDSSGADPQPSEEPVGV
jgi:hydrophobic/amphiphilic exporter-1 (mainly G- bacteria), HAE1 family